MPKNKTGDREEAEARRRGQSEAEHGASGMPDMIRRLAALGLSGFFTTEGALRRALGDTLPQDWVDFAAEQSERTREELLDRVADEFGKVLEQVDLGALMGQLLDGRTVEVTAQFRLKPTEGPAADPVDPAEIDSTSAAKPQV